MTVIFIIYHCSLGVGVSRAHWLVVGIKLRLIEQLVTTLTDAVGTLKLDDHLTWTGVVVMQ